MSSANLQSSLQYWALRLVNVVIKKQIGKGFCFFLTKNLTMRGGLWCSSMASQWILYDFCHVTGACLAQLKLVSLYIHNCWPLTVCISHSNLLYLARPQLKGRKCMFSLYCEHWCTSWQTWECSHVSCFVKQNTNISILTCSQWQC